MKPPFTPHHAWVRKSDTAFIQDHGAPQTPQTARKRERRMPHRVPCRVRIVEPATGLVRTVSGQTVNLSPGGAALLVGMDVPVGTWVETLVPHAHGDPLFLCGRVVHVRRTLASDFEIGIATQDQPPPFA
jgi:hypothetical protein